MNDDLSKVLNEIIDELANSTMPKASGEGERGNNVNTNNNSDRNVGSVSNRRKVNLDIDTNSGNINIRGVLDVGFSIFADTDADFAF